MTTDNVCGHFVLYAVRAVAFVSCDASFGIESGLIYSIVEEIFCSCHLDLFIVYLLLLVKCGERGFQLSGITLLLLGRFHLLLSISYLSGKGT